MHQSPRRAAGGQRPVERRERERRGERGAQGRAHHPPREGIEHHGEIAPALRGREEGHIAHPELIGLSGGELLTHVIGTHRQPVVTVGGDPEAPGLLAPNPVRLHQSRDPMAAAGEALAQQLPVHPGTPVGAIDRRVDLVHRPHQLPIGLGPAALAPLAPGVEAAAGHVEQLTAPPQGERARA